MCSNTLFIANGERPLFSENDKIETSFLQFWNPPEDPDIMRVMTSSAWFNRQKLYCIDVK